MQPLIVNLPRKGSQNEDLTETRFAMRGVARNDKDRVAADVLALVIQGYCHRMLNNRNDRQLISVEHNSYRIGGFFLIRQNKSNLLTAEIYKCANDTIQTLLNGQPDYLLPILPYALKWAKTHKQAQLANNFNLSPLENLAITILNENVTGISLTDEFRAIDAVSEADIRRVAKRLLQNFPQSSVVVGDVKSLKAAFNNSGKTNVEVTDAKSLVVSLSSAPAQTTANTNSNVRPLTSLSPTFTPTNKPTRKQPFPLPKPKIMPTPTPSPTPVPPKQP